MITMPKRLLPLLLVVLMPAAALAIAPPATPPVTPPLRSPGGATVPPVVATATGTVGAR